MALNFPEGTQDLPARVIQCVQGTKSDKATTTSTSWVDLNLNASITPKLSSSRILVHVQLGSFCNRLASKRAFASLVRGSSHILHGTNSTGAECSIALCTRSNNDNYIQVPVSMHYLDQPNTTSSTTYTVYYKCGADGGTATVNSSYSQDSNTGNATSTIILMEVAT